MKDRMMSYQLSEAWHKPPVQDATNTFKFPNVSLHPSVGINQWGTPCIDGSVDF